MRQARLARRTVVVGLSAGGVLTAFTALRLRLQHRGGETAAAAPADAPVADEPYDPAPNLAVTVLPGTDLGPRGIARTTLGALTVDAGRIVAADPLVQPERAAFARPVPPGRYPVLLYTAQGRIALAELRIAEGAPARWVIAVIPGQDADSLKGGEIFGYPVDAGLGCFMDETGRDALLAREAREQNRIGKDFNAYDDLLREPIERAGNEVLLYEPTPGEPANVAIFHSGWGDGFYPSYWGLDAAERPVRLVTDFGVLDRGEGRTPNERWTQDELARMTPEQCRDATAAGAALRVGDVAALETLLKQGRATPLTPVAEMNEPLVHLAIALDKPAMLDLLVRYGADPVPPPALGLPWKTFPAFARSYAETSDAPPGGAGPRSTALMAVIARWERAATPTVGPR